MLSFPFRPKNANRDFTLISKTIDVYYPSKSSKRLTGQRLSKTKGFKAKSLILQKEFTDEYKSKWAKFAKIVKSNFNKPLEQYPPLSGACMQGDLILSSVKYSDFQREKRLRFFISAIGPFFSIQGVDTSTAILPTELRRGEAHTGHFQATHVITVSPSFEYEEPFIKLEQGIKSFFPGYRFVPYEIGMSTRRNISTSDEIDNDEIVMDTIYEGLFARSAVRKCPTRGNRNYGKDDWRKPMTKKGNDLRETMRRHAQDAPSTKTIHKIWKVQEVEHKPTPPGIHLIVKLFDVIDFFNPSEAIKLNKDDSNPIATKYEFDGNAISMNGSLAFKISKLTKNSLTLEFILNFSEGKFGINGVVRVLHLVPLDPSDSII
ncbi:MAG: hypothetical protein QM762_09480 [Chryseolinea sp.]